MINEDLYITFHESIAVFMRKVNLFGVFLILISETVFSQTQHAKNPVIFADVPDISIVRVGDSYYMHQPVPLITLRRIIMTAVNRS